MINTATLTIGSLLAMSSLGGCDNINRSLLFYTNTNVGVEIGVDPAQPMPRIIIGYKRAEGVLNPVYLPPEKLGNTTTTTETETKDTNGTSITVTKTTTVSKGPGVTVKDVYREKAYSVIAKLKGKGEGKSKIDKAGEVVASGEIAQWFATGKAADILADKDGTASALSGKTAKTPGKVSKSLSGLDSTAVAGQLKGVYDGLSQWAKTGDLAAKNYVSEIDKLASEYFLTTNVLKVHQPGSPAHMMPNSGTFSNLISVPILAETTIDQIKTKLAAAPAPAGAALSTLQSDLQLAQFHLNESREKLYGSKVIIEAVEYYAGKLVGK